MKVKTLVIIFPIIALSLGACVKQEKPKEPDKPFSFERVDYDIKDGYTEDDLQGAPWINANIPGQVEMVEQPSIKDDFYTAANYEMYMNNEYGPFDLSSFDVRSVLNSIYNGTAENYPNKALFDKARSLMVDGSATYLRNYLDNLNVSNYLSSKDVFLGNCGLLRLYKDGDTYHIEFNDGYNNDITGYQTLAYYGYFSNQDEGYDVYNQYAIAIAKEIYSALGYSNAQTMAEVGHEYVKELIFTMGTPAPSLATVNDLEIDGLKSALLDAGLTLFDKIKITYDNYSQIDNLYNISNSEHFTEFTYAIKNIIAFEHRHLLGVNAYKPISQYTANLYYFFPDEVNLTYSNNYTASCYMSQWLLPFIFEKAYLYFEADPEVKEIVTNLINDILAEYKEMVSAVDWLQDESKEAIIKKLDKMDYTSCYSEKMKNFPTVPETGVSGWTLLDIYNAYNYTIIDAAVNDELETNATLYSGMHSYTVNAFYSPTTNEFVILNGLLSGGFVDDDVEVTYARVGTVIGHEISHAFDSSGAYFNENGVYNASGWWKRADMKEFKNRVKKLQKFWDKINLYDDNYVNGDQIDGEATADMGGVAVMLKLAKKIRRFDYDKFFRAYASLWKEEYYDLARMNQDSHPYAYLRTNVTLAQFDEFVKTYHLKSGDGMYIPKDERVKIW